MQTSTKGGKQKARGGSIVNSKLYNMVQTKQPSKGFSDIVVPVRINDEIGIKKSTKSVIPKSSMNSLIMDPTQTPSTPIVYSPVNNIINVPQNIVTNTPIKISPLVNIGTPVDTPVSVDIPVTVAVPTFKFPFFIPGGGGGGGRGGRGFGIGKVKGKYTASLIAQVYNIKSKKKPKVITGFSIRPIVG